MRKTFAQFFQKGQGFWEVSTKKATISLGKHTKKSGS